MFLSKWIQAPPIQPGWYWYRDIPLREGIPVVLEVDHRGNANGVGCSNIHVEALPGHWWSELLIPPV